MSEIQKAVQEKYGAIAASVTASSLETGCCEPRACGCGDPITSNLYSESATKDLPAGAVRSSLGCGNPTALIALEAGQTVLDLGSGGGMARRSASTRPARRTAST
jgi:arsenite methyltransferase